MYTSAATSRWFILLYHSVNEQFHLILHALPASETFKPSINLIPFYFGSCGELPGACLMNIIGNILLTVPFGFGVSFVMRLKAKDILWLAIGVGLAFETIQLIVSVIFRSSFRSVDINDVILNAAGVLLGFVIFGIFVRLYSRLGFSFPSNLT